MTEFMKGNGRKGKEKNFGKNKNDFMYSQKRVRQLADLLTREGKIVHKKKERQSK